METQEDELGEDQALLILYLAGELPEPQHLALERRLESEPSLRQELESLRAAQAMIWREMLAADSEEPLKGVASTAHRKLAGMVRQWAVHRLAKEPRPTGRVIAWGRWTSAAAAVLAVGLGLAIYFYPSTIDDDEVAVADAPVQPPAEIDAQQPASLEPFEEALVSATLNEVEAELNELTELRLMTIDQ
jgi:anti-sigma factor RsiW